MDTLVSLPVGNNSVFSIIQQDERNDTRLVAVLSHSLVLIEKMTGRLELIVGVPDVCDYHEDEGSRARFDFIDGLLQTTGRWIISDTGNHCLRVYDISTRRTYIYAGFCKLRGKEMGRLIDARLTEPAGLVRDPSGDLIYLIDRGIGILVIDFSAGIIHLWAKLSHPYKVNMLIFDPLSDSLIVNQECYLNRIYMNRTIEPWHNTKLYADGDFCDAAIWGFAFIMPSYIIATDIFENQLIVFEPMQTQPFRICQKHHCTICDDVNFQDGSIQQCRLESPNGILVTKDFIYIGESGEHGGGVRRLTYNVKSHESTAPTESTGVMDQEITTPNESTVFTPVSITSQTSHSADRNTSAGIKSDAAIDNKDKSIVPTVEVDTVNAPNNTNRSNDSRRGILVSTSEGKVTKGSLAGFKGKQDVQGVC